MPKSPPGAKEMVAFKIGARARKFALEGFPIEGYEYLYAALNESKEADPELYNLLQSEFAKFEKRLTEIDEDG